MSLFLPLTLGGAFPSAILSRANFTTLDVEYTSLSGSLSSMEVSTTISSLVLVNNAQMGPALPTLSSHTALNTL